MKKKKVIINKDSTVAVELKKFDADLIKKYSVFLNSTIEGFRDSGYDLDSIVEGFKTIGVEISTGYILKHTIEPLNENEVIISYYRTGYSVHSIVKKFGRSLFEVQQLIQKDENLRVNRHNEWLRVHGILVAG